MLIEDELAKIKAERDAFKEEVEVLKRKIARAQTQLTELISDWTDSRASISFLTRQVDEVNAVLERVYETNESLRKS